MATSVEGIDDGAGFGVKGTATGGDGVVGTTRGIHKVGLRGVHTGHISAIAIQGELELGIAAIKGEAGASTSFSGDEVSGSGVWGDSSIGPGVAGTSTAGPGVIGESPGTNGVLGSSNTAAGVLARSDSAPGLHALSNTGVGVLAESQSGEGVHASSHSEGAAAVAGIGLSSGPGVYGVSEKFDGVVGIAKAEGRSGVAGISDSGVGVYGKGGHRAGLFIGDLEITGALHLGGADYAEELAVGSLPVAPGHCVVLAEDGCVAPCTADYDTRVAGVISGAGGLRPAIVLDPQPNGTGAPLALMGKAFVYVDADRGPIRVGDMLTTSSTSGHAMAVSDTSRAFGAVIGKALTALPSGRGLVKALLSAR